MKKFVSLLLALVLCLCSFSALAERAPIAKEDIKIGFIFLHDENSTYDLNFINAAKEACEKLGIAYEMQTNIPGIFAAGDCAGVPYQLAKAVGEGNVATHSILEYLAEREAGR